MLGYKFFFSVLLAGYLFYCCDAVIVIMEEVKRSNLVVSDYFKEVYLFNMGGFQLWEELHGSAWGEKQESKLEQPVYYCHIDD